MYRNNNRVEIIILEIFLNIIGKIFYIVITKVFSLHVIGIDFIFEQRPHVSVHHFIRRPIFPLRETTTVDKETRLKSPSPFVFNIPNLYSCGDFFRFTVHFQREHTAVNTRNGITIRRNFYSDALVFSLFYSVFLIFHRRFHRKKHIGQTITCLIGHIVNIVHLVDLNVFLMIHVHLVGGNRIPLSVRKLRFYQLVRGNILPSRNHKLRPLRFVFHHRKINFRILLFIHAQIPILRHFYSGIGAPYFRCSNLITLFGRFTCAVTALRSIAIPTARKPYCCQQGKQCSCRFFQGSLHCFLL